MTHHHPGRRPASRPGPRPVPGGGPQRRGGGVPDGVLLGGLGLLVGVTVLTWSATGLGGLAAHGRWPGGVTFLRTATAVRSFLTAPDDPAAAWPDADPAALPNAAVLWLMFLLQVALLFSAVLWVAVLLARRRSRREAPVSVAAPAPAQEPARLGRTPEPPGPPGTPVGAERPAAPEPPPPGSGGTAEAVLAAPGGLVVVDPDGRLWSRTARRRGTLGPVHVYDPGHVTDAPVRLRWAPQRGCEEMPVAARRAAALLAPVRPPEPVFRLDAETAETLLRCYLHAAALSGEPLQQVHRWALGKAAGDPAKVLRTHARAAGGAAMELEHALSAHPERREAGLRLIGLALAGLARLHIRQSCSPGRADTLAVDNVAGEGGTLYVAGNDEETACLRSALLDALDSGQPGLAVIGRR